MALNVAALTTYNDEISSGLVKEILIKANTINGDIVSKMFGLHGVSLKLNYVKTNMTGSNALCGFNPSGSTTLAQSTMNLCPISFMDNICIDTLQQYWYSWELENKYYTESLGTYEETFLANKTEYIAKELDRIAWQGNKATGTGNLALCDGFLAVAAANSASTVNVTRSAFTITTAVAIVDAILANIPAQIIDAEDLELFLSPSDFQIYLTALRQANLFRYDTDSTGVSKINHPGSIALTVVKTNGLAGTPSGTFIATVKENIVLGISDESDLDFKTWYSMDNDEIRMKAKIKIGTAFYFPELVVRSI
jgi:hypothetical protein